MAGSVASSDGDGVPVEPGDLGGGDAGVARRGAGRMGDGRDGEAARPGIRGAAGRARCHMSRHPARILTWETGAIAVSDRTPARLTVTAGRPASPAPQPRQQGGSWRTPSVLSQRKLSGSGC
jgi:hypothetical protein